MKADQKTQLSLFSLTWSSIKNTTATCLIKMYDYVQDNSHLLVNGFVKAGISQAIEDSIANAHAE